MLVFAKDRNLRKQREVNIVVGRTKVSDLAVAARFLAFEIVRGEAEHSQAVGALVLIQTLQSRVLRSQAALGRHIHNQQHLAAIVRQAAAGAVDQSQRNVV